MVDQSTITALVHKQRILFNEGKTKDISFRVCQLENLKKALLENEERILDALMADLRKPPFEAYTGELGFALHEIEFAKKNLGAWAKPMKVKTPLVHFPASSYIYSEPLGVVLIIGTWNFPLATLVVPLVGAIAAGDCTILKPSEVTSHTSGAVARIMRENFDLSFIAVVEGGPEETQMLLSEKLDHIFFTGGASVGKTVMEAAAKYLTSVTLELSGKTPCIVDNDVHVNHTAKRIVLGKFINAGQICITPDYLLVHKAIKKQLLESLKRYVKEFYGGDPSKSPDYARIINDRHFSRLSHLIQEGEIIVGGNTNPEDRYIAPTVIDNVLLKHKIMEEEILGPILPVIEYEDLTDAISIVNERPKPVALYFFSKNRKNQERVLRETSSGGVCINDTVVHMVTSFLPFGGVGTSGMGSYHGKASFDTFSHKKSTMKRSFLVDIKTKYPPYKEDLKYLKWVMKCFM